MNVEDRQVTNWGFTYTEMWRASKDRVTVTRETDGEDFS